MKQTILKNSKIRLILSWLIAILCLLYLFWKIDFHSLWQVFLKAKPIYIGFVALLNIWVLAIKAERWRRITQPLVSLAPLEAQCLTILGFWGNTILPARAGDFGRGLYLSRKGIPWVSGVSTVGADKLLDALGLLGFVVVFFPTLPPFLRKDVLVSLILVTLALIIVLFLVRRYSLEDLDNAPNTLFKGLILLSTGFKSFRDGKLFIQTYLLSLLSWFLQTEMLVFSAKALGLDLSFPTALITLIGLNFLLVLPTPPSGVGLMHAAIVFILGLFDYPKVLALGIAIIYHGVQTLVLCLLGPVCLLLKGRLLSVPI